MSTQNIRLYEIPFVPHVSHIFDYCIGVFRACSWLSKLPEMIAQVDSPPTLQYCARAACMIFYGKFTNNLTIQVEGLGLYDRALQSQRRVLGLLDNDSSSVQSSHHSTEESICATVLMSYIELVMGSSPDSWMQHVDAAAALISIRESHTCQTGIAHQLFISVRLGTVGYQCAFIPLASVLMRKLLKICSSIIRQRPHKIATEEWSIAHYKHNKTPLDYLLDILQLYPDILNEYTMFMDTKVDTGGRRSAIKAKISSLVCKFDRWATYFTRLSENERACMFPGEWKAGTTSWGLPQVEPNNQSITLLSCLFAAGCALSFSLLFSLEPDNSSFRDKTQQHCELILSATESLDSSSRGPISSICLLAVFPLRVVATWSPCPLQRESAYRKAGCAMTASPFVGCHNTFAN